MQQQSAAAASSISECRQARAQLLEEILEAERQVMLWEKKITLERETQQALDPEVGTSEVAGMMRNERIIWGWCFNFSKIL